MSIEISSLWSDDTKIGAVVVDTENDWRCRVVATETHRSTNGKTLAGSEHDDVCRALGVAFMEMMSGNNITEKT